MELANYKNQELKRVRDIARAYSKQGYEVSINPTKGDLPSFLIGYQPDLIARKNDDHVIIEVVSSASRKSRAKQLRKFAKSAAERRGWRFELVSASGDFSSQEQEYWGADELRNQLDSALNLKDQRYHVAAILQGWSAFEASARLALSGTIAEYRPPSPSYLVKALYNEGLIDRSGYDAAIFFANLRNAAAHGYKTSGPYRIYLRRLVHIGKDLLENYESQQAGLCSADDDVLYGAIAEAEKSISRPFGIYLRSIPRSKYSASDPRQVPLLTGGSESEYAVEVMVTKRHRDISVRDRLSKSEIEELAVEIWNEWMGY